MFKIQWDNETGGIRLSALVTANTVNIPPRPVFYEELDLLGLDKLGWEYPRCEEPLLWACNKQYYYRGELAFEAKGANLYDKATIEFVSGKEKMEIVPIDMARMLERTQDQMFLCESEAIEFIRDTYDTYTRANKLTEKYAANQVDFEQLVAKIEKKTKQRMAIVKEDCDSFDIMTEEDASKRGKKVLHTTKVDYFLASFSGGKDSQVVLDLCTRALPPDAFRVIYSDTGYELPSSLELYEQVQNFYHKRFPALIFETTKNHESVLSYWDKIGTPSDTHRWCCTIMKTAPLYRIFKVPGTNKQAKVLTIDGVRAEESTKRANYERIGKGKHINITNAHPILNWNTPEIFLYLFRHKLPINTSYRLGKARVGCIVCPFSSSWDDMIVKQTYPNELEPFETRLQNWAKKIGIKDIETYMKERKWKIKALGNKSDTDVIFQEKEGAFIATVINSNHNIYTWLPTLGEYTFKKIGKADYGELRYKGLVYKFKIEYSETNKTRFILYNTNTELTYLLKRVVYKSAYCVQCEVCEVDCPHGALTIVPSVYIDKHKCKHCHSCLKAHDRGCIATDCIRMINDTDKKMSARVQAYKTFGFREAWLNDFIYDPEDFWSNNVLGPAQVDGFKAWLKDAEIIDNKNALTDFGQLLQKIHIDVPDVMWELIFVNLCYNSYIINWFANNIQPNHSYEKKSLTDAIVEANPGVPIRTIENALTALMQTFSTSPIGESMGNCYEVTKGNYQRQEFSDLSNIGLAYSIYRFAEMFDTKSLRVSDFFDINANNGAVKEFGLSLDTFEKKLRSLNSDQNRVLIANLSMGLQHITLRDDINSNTVVKVLLGI